ncbi:MAG: hypothetical protein AAF741_15625 [Bacteroidota bacterium]
MARTKSLTITQEDILYACGGALGGIALNGVLSKVLESQPESTRSAIGKALPAAKLIGGGYLATQKKQDRKMRMLGLGVAATGTLELGIKFAPQYFSISGTGDVFDMLGDTTDVLALPIVPSAEFDEVPDTDGVLMGTDTGDEYAML